MGAVAEKVGTLSAGLDDEAFPQITYSATGCSTRIPDSLSACEKEDGLMAEMLWTFEDVARFVTHPDRPLRHWALERLTNRFPGRAAEALLPMLDDEDSYLAFSAARALADTGDAARYGPLLLARLEGAGRDHPRAGYLAESLARLGVREALPLILARLAGEEQDADAPDLDEFLYLVSALGSLGGEPARQALWRLLDERARPGTWHQPVIDALLEAAQPDDVARLVAAIRSRPAGAYLSRTLDALGDAAGVGHVASSLAEDVAQGLDRALDALETWLSRRPPLSAECLLGLEAAFHDGWRGLWDVLLAETRRLVRERGDDVAGWQAAWEAGERPVGYRHRAVLALLLMEAFARQPLAEPERRHAEAALGLALLAGLSLDRDDQARLEAAADRQETLLTILAEDRDPVLPDVVEQVAALRPAVVPRLIALLQPDDFGWAPIRAARAIKRIAHEHPGSCDAAVPALVGMIGEEQGDYVLEDSSAALVAIGPAAVPLVAAHLHDDMASRIYLTSVLGEIPTPDAAQAVLGLITPEAQPDESEIYALSNIGSALAIEPLYALWQARRGRPRDLAEALLVLCELNGVVKPELPAWRQTTTEEADLLDSMGAGIAPLLRSLAGSPAEVPPKTGPDRPSTRPGKGYSKKEQKKRAAQRKQSRQGKRKRKK